jgi:hypothetical protein
MYAIDEEQTIDIRALQSILEDAVQGSAGAVELEYVTEGLEVSYMFGNTGLGTVLTDRELIGKVTSAIVEKAGLDTEPDGKFCIDLFGEQHTIIVKTYESFGETCFRLALDELSV